MSRYSKLLVKFQRARDLLKKAAYMATLPQLPYVVKQPMKPGEAESEEEWASYLYRGEQPTRDWPGYETHNELHEQAARERRQQPKEYIGFDPNAEEGADDRPPPDKDELTFEEFETGWPPSIPTD